MVNRTVSLLATGVSGHLSTSPQEKAPKDTHRISLRQVWYLTPVMPALRRLTQVDHFKFKTSLGYRGRLCSK